LRFKTALIAFPNLAGPPPFTRIISKIDFEVRDRFAQPVRIVITMFGGMPFVCPSWRGSGLSRARARCWEFFEQARIINRHQRGYAPRFVAAHRGGRWFETHAM